jgi:hypothetical protein
MSAEIIYGVDFRNKRRDPLPTMAQLDAEGIRIINEAFPLHVLSDPIAAWHSPDTAPCEMIPYGGAGIDGMFPDAS